MHKLTAMDLDERPRPKGDLASQLATELLDPYSHGELNERIRLIERSNKAPDEKRRMILDLQRQKDLLARRLSA